MASRLAFGLRAISISAAALLFGCASRPAAFDSPFGDPDAPPTVQDLLDKLECEDQFAAGNKTIGADFDSQHYFAAVNLTLEVTNNQGVNPSLNYITPYRSVGTGLTQSLGFQLTATQHRTFNLAYTIDLSKPSDEQGCAAQKVKLQGTLGLKGIVEAGLAYSKQSGHRWPLFAAAMERTKPSAAVAPIFGATIDFTVVKGIGGAGPTWTVKHFKGPNGGNPGLINLSRTEKNTLVVSFAAAGAATQEVTTSLHDMESYLISPIPEGATPEGIRNLEATRSLILNTQALQRSIQALTPTSNEAAAKAAQDNNTRMILQNLLPNP